MTGPAVRPDDAFLARIAARQQAQADSVRAAGPQSASPASGDFADVEGGASSKAVPIDVEAIREKARDQSLRDTGMLMIQGVTGQFGDELGLTDRSDIARIRKEIGPASYLGDAAGAALNPLSQLGSGLSGAMLSGGLMSGISGAGAGENADERLAGAAGGALAGVVLPGIVGGGMKLASKAPDIIARIVASKLGIPPNLASLVKRLASQGGAEASATSAALPKEPLSPSDLVDQLPASMQTGRGGAGKVAPPQVVSPAAAEASLPPELQTSRGLGPRAVIPPEMGTTVPAGPYQKAAPSTRMQSPNDAREIMAQKLVADPAAIQMQIDLARAMGVEPHPGLAERLAELLAQRSLPR